MLSLLAVPVMAQAPLPPLTVGVLVTLSGPGAVIGQHARDGFALALKQRGGKLGGREVKLVVVDDELKPDVAVERAKRLVEQDHADFVVGPIFSNILGAIMRPVTASAILISPNAGSSVFAGKGCNPNFFVASYENNQVHQVLGQVAQERGYKRAFLMAPNYQAGKDAIAGFKSKFKGEVLDEDYVPLTQLDFQADLARIASLKPDVIFAFMPGGLGVALVKQFRQSGLAETVPFLSAFTVDESTLPAQQAAAVGLYGAGDWAPDMDNAAEQGVRAGVRGGVQVCSGQLRRAGVRCGPVDRCGRDQDGGGHGGQGEAAGGVPFGADRFAARGVPAEHQRLSDPGLLSDPGGCAAGREVLDRGAAARVS